MPKSKHSTKKKPAKTQSRAAKPTLATNPTDSVLSQVSNANPKTRAQKAPPALHARASASPNRSENEQRCVAFLRGVNIGGRTVKSPELVASFSQLGLKEVAAFLASGNVVFTSNEQPRSQLAGAIEKHLCRKFGFEVPIILRSMEDVCELASGNPFDLSPSEKATMTVHVGFLTGELTTPERKHLTALRSDYDDFTFAGREFFWLCRGQKISNSVVFAKNLLTKAVQQVHTLRNQRTLERMAKKFA